MEILYPTRCTSEYAALETELDGFRILLNDCTVANAAMSTIGELAEHRATDTTTNAALREGSRRSGV